MSKPTLADGLSATLAVFDDTAAGEPLTTTEVSDRLEVSRRRATDHLRRLAQRGFLEEKPVGASGRVWWLSSVDAETTQDSSADGLSADFGAITSRKQRAQRLAQYEQLVETVDDGIYAVDESSRLIVVNEAFCSLTGYDRAELLDAPATKLYDPDELPETDRLRALRSGDSDVVRVDIDIQTKVGDVVQCETRIAPFPLYGGATGRCGVVRDVSERVGFERRLKRLNTMSQRLLTAASSSEVHTIAAETITDLFDGTAVAIYRYDDLPERLVPAESTFQSASLSPLPVDDTTLLGTVFAAETVQYHSDIADRAPIPLAAGETARQSGAFLPLGDVGVLVVGHRAVDAFDTDSRQILELLAATVEAALVKVTDAEELARRIHQQQVVTELSQRALDQHDIDAFMAEATADMAETLGTDYCKILDYREGEASLSLREGVGWDEGIVGSATVSAVEDSSQAAYTLDTDEPVVVTDLRNEPRFSGPDLLTDHDVRSGISVVIGSSDDPWGILGAHDTSQQSFTEQDVNFTQSVANILASMLRRHEDEQVVLRQREQLAALNSLNDVVRDISEAVIAQSSRDEIEQVVCERLAATDSYEFAWIGTVDHRSQMVEVSTEAGVENYLDGIAISIDPADDRSEGPTGRAFRNGTVQSAQHVSENPDYREWRDHASAYGYRSSVAIPLVHDELIYGVLNVYTDRPDGFLGYEREVVEQLGEIVGHAIAAVERKRALLSDEVIELGFHVADLFSMVDIDSVDGTVVFDDVVSISEEEFVLYGRVAVGAEAALTALTETIVHWEDVTFHDERGTTETRQFELRLSDPPVLSTIAAVGGTIADAGIEDGVYHMTVQLPPGPDVRKVIDTVTETYPEAKMVTRQQKQREMDLSPATTLELTDSLTDRQRAALQAAYYSGFFEWPRNVSGEEVADSLGVSAPTFHQHLRKAEKKIFDSVVPVL